MKFFPKKVALVIATHPEYELYCPNFTGMQDGLRDLGIEYKVFSCRLRKDFDPKKVIDYKPDLVVYGLPDMALVEEWRARIRAGLQKAKIVMWYGDWRANLELTCNMSEIDCMFASNDASAEYYLKYWKVPRFQFLPLGASIKNPEFKKKFNFPVVFIGQKFLGGWKQDRAMKLQMIEESGVGLTILNGDAQQNPGLRAKIMKEVPNIYFSSKITMDMSHFSGIQGYTSNRCWIIPACKGFAISEYWPGCEEFFPEGTRVWFKTIEEGISKIKWYLNHDDERLKIRIAGMENAKNNTYDKRWLRMFDFLC